jgi:uncharacterized protein (UPF0548 family)
VTVRHCAHQGSGWSTCARAALGQTRGVRWTRDAVSLPALKDKDLTYAEVGGTAWERLPEGYRTFDRRASLGVGEDAFDRAAGGLMAWDMQRRAGLSVHASHPMALPGTDVVVGLGPSWLGLGAPCRVIYAVDERDRRGFAYGTLPGHPETGEEAFLVDLDPSGRVSFSVRTFSRPALFLARAGRPLTHRLQDVATNRYLRAMRALAAP